MLAVSLLSYPEATSVEQRDAIEPDAGIARMSVGQAVTIGSAHFAALARKLSDLFAPLGSGIGGQVLVGSLLAVVASLIWFLVR
jgi:hypothetical protein